MRAIQELVEGLQRDWSVPRLAPNGAFRLVCRFGAGARRLTLPYRMPDDVVSFWSESDGAELFVDADYGQWGLKVLGSQEGLNQTEKLAETRRQHIRPGDFVIGSFLGDTDLLVVRCDAAALDFGTVFVALPLYARNEWYFVGESFTAFVNQYVDSVGEKFWENSRSGAVDSTR